MHSDEPMSGEKSPPWAVKEDDPLTRAVIGAAIEVHRHLGPGLLESVYEACLHQELTSRGIPFVRQVEMPVLYKGVAIDACYRLDLLVADQLIVELKAVEQLLPIHEAQLLTYLRLTNKHTGLLINFNAPVLVKGIKRMKL
jgi:GxxExxY protein